jgi:DNA polymerase I-like protein with 3'-5' exonuclease and polymerase domains
MPGKESKTIHPKLRNRLINIPVQSTAADLFKLALGLLYGELCKSEYAEFQFLLSLHDSVLFECPAERTEECSELIDHMFMVAANEIFQDVPCKADIKVGSNWSFKEPEKVVVGADCTKG